METDQNKTEDTTSQEQHDARVVRILIFIALFVTVALIAYLQLKPEVLLAPSTSEYGYGSQEEADTVAEEAMVDGADEEQDTHEESEDTAVVEDEEPAVLGEPDADGIRWYNKWVEMDDLGLVISQAWSAPTYYLLGEQENGKRVILIEQKMIGTVGYKLVEQADGTFLFLNKYNDSVYSESYYDSERVPGTSDAIFESLDVQDEVIHNGMTLERFVVPFQGLKEFQKTDDYILVESTVNGELYELDAIVEYSDKEVEGEFTYGAYVLRLADNTSHHYRVQKGFIADDNSIAATWNTGYEAFADGQFLTGYFPAGKCGNGGYDEYIPADAIDDLEHIGTTAAGEKLYTITATDNRALELAYAAYMVGRSSGGSYEILSYEDFSQVAALLVYESGNGDFIGLLNTEYGSLVECGKPVIYLYPETEQEVSVEVGADVTVSEPYYGEGWTVTAQPNGDLTWTDGEVYPNLFWEGTGYGEYPVIDFGRVVESKNIEAELLSDLRAQGLNEQEIADFMEFWLPLMPTTPYTRLSWFTTEQMNTLAPLRVKPMPQSVQRVFLDFEGVETLEHDLRPQELTSFQRTGFTLVEWGGLLVGGHESAQ